MREVEIAGAPWSVEISADAAKLDLLELDGRYYRVNQAAVFEAAAVVSGMSSPEAEYVLDAQPSSNCIRVEFCDENDRLLFEELIGGLR